MTDHSPYLQAIHALTGSIRRLRDNPLSVYVPDYTTTDVLSCIDTLVVCAQREHDLLTTKVDELEQAPAPAYPSYTPIPVAYVVMTPPQYDEVWDLMTVSLVGAIKLCRQYSGVGLMEAKLYVEHMLSRAAQNEIVPDPPEVDDDLPF